MSDYSHKDILVYLLRKLGHKKHMLNLAQDTEYQHVIVNYIKYMARRTKDVNLIKLIECYL